MTLQVTLTSSYKLVDFSKFMAKSMLSLVYAMHSMLCKVCDA